MRRNRWLPLQIAMAILFFTGVSTALATAKDDSYSATVNGACTTLHTISLSGKTEFLVLVGSDKIPLAKDMIDMFINEGGYFWWLPSNHQALEPTVGQDLLDAHPEKIKVLLAHSPCSSDTTTATPPKVYGYVCASKYSKKPFSATLAVVTQRLAAKKAFSPFWVAGRTTLGVTAGTGRLVCAIPSGMKTDGVYRDGNGKVLMRKPGLARLAGAYPEVKRS